MLTIITPCCRPENLQKLFASLDFDRLDRWLIVHDSNEPRKLFTHEKICEIHHRSPPDGRAGHAQRNAGLECVSGGLIYFLDDDTVIHPDFWKISPVFDEDHFYTFDQQRWDEFVETPGGTFRGNEPKLLKMDSAQYVVPRKMCGTFVENDYRADGFFIEEVGIRNPLSHVYIPIVACYYNYLRK